MSLGPVRPAQHGAGDTAFEETVDVDFREAQALPQHLAAVLEYAAEPRRRQVGAFEYAADAPGVAAVAVLPHVSMHRRPEPAPMLKMRTRHQLGGRAYDAGGNAGSLQTLHQVLGPLSARPLCDGLVEALGVGDAVPVTLEERVFQGLLA